jgi:hypothetical protein
MVRLPRGPKARLSANGTVLSGGLACFPGATKAGCRHGPLVVGGRKPKGSPEFRWVGTLPGNVETSPSGAYHAFKFGKYANRHLAAIAYRFNRRFQLKSLTGRLLAAAATSKPRTGAWLRMAELPC